MFVKGPLLLCVELISIGNFCDHAHGQLCRKLKLCAQKMIDKFVEIELTEDLSVPGYMRSGISGSVGAIKRLSERVELFLGGFKFQTDGQFHEADNNKNSLDKKNYLSC